MKEILIERSYKPDSDWRKKVTPSNSDCSSCIKGFCSVTHNKKRRNKKPRKTKANCGNCLAGKKCQFHGGIE